MQNPRPSYAHHQLQPHLSSLLSAAAGDPPHPSDDASRTAALSNLRLSFLHPPNRPLLPALAPFLAPPLSVLLADDASYAVRRAAVSAYATLCAMLCSHEAPGGLPDGFVAWALPLLGDPSSAALVAEGLRELLSTGDVAPLERFVPPLLAACRDVLEDERTSLAVLRCLLSLLMLIAAKFPHCFRPQFVDIMDLLLGWVFVPDLADADRSMIMDSFLQFQWHWLGNLQFSLGLLPKFLADMEVLVHDPNLAASHNSGRLRPLFACFSTVLQIMVSGVAERNNLRELVAGPLEGLAPQLLRCASVIASKLGWSERMEEASRCLVLLAEILQERFAEFYVLFVDVWAQSLEVASSAQLVAALKTNLQVLSLQNLGLRASSVGALLDFSSILSKLRLHPNHTVVANSAATYLFCLRHGLEDVVDQAITSLMKELELIKSLLEEGQVSYPDLQSLSLESNNERKIKSNPGAHSWEQYLEDQLLSLMKFDLKILLTTIALDTKKRNERATSLTSFISEKLDPFGTPFHNFLEMQFQIFSTLHKLSNVELSSNMLTSEPFERGAGGSKNQLISCECKKKFVHKYGKYIVQGLNASSSMALKLEALDWIASFENLIRGMERDVDKFSFSYEVISDATLSNDILFTILDCAYDREPKVRCHVALTLELLFLGRLINPMNFSVVTQVLLDKLSDPDSNVKDAFLRLFSIALPITTYAFGLLVDKHSYLNSSDIANMSNHCMNWRHVPAVKQQPRKLHWQQLVSILSYLSLRLKLPLSSWVQRLVFSYRGKKDMLSGQTDVSGDADGNELPKGPGVNRATIDRIYTVNNHAAVWWGIHEAARHCINLRLRTHLGGPTQTFAALERMLLDVTNVLTLEAKEGEGRYIGPADICLLPMRLLLDFVEALKKYAYNAYEGSFVLSPPPKASTMFFRANKRVCEEWFSRICDPMLNAGLAMHCTDAVVHYCSLRLVDLRNLAESSLRSISHTGGATESHHGFRQRLEADVLKVLRHASLALCRCHETDALVGLQKWTVSSFYTYFEQDNQPVRGLSDCDKHFSWMSGLIYQSQGQYEKAAAHYSHLLQSEEALTSMKSDGIQFIIERVIECYTSLSDWKCLESWLAELQVLRAVHAGKPYSGALTSAGNELNAIHAMACFDNGDFNSAWGYLDLTPKSSSELTLDPKVALERSELMLLRGMLQSNSKLEGIKEELDKAKLMLDEALSVAPLNGLPEAAACASQLHCILAFEEASGLTCRNGPNQSQSIMDSLLKVLHDPIDRMHQDCSMWLKVFKVYRSTQPSSLSTLLLCQKLASLARKQGNFMLATRLNQYLINHPLKSSDEMDKEILELNIKYEGALLKHEKGNSEEALIDMWSLVRGSVLSTISCSSDIGTSHSLIARACLKLSTWMEQENSTTISTTFIPKVIEDFRDSDGSQNGTQKLVFGDSVAVSTLNYHELTQEIIGTVRKISWQLCPSMGKAWLAYASWCFTHASYSLSGKELNFQNSLFPVLQSELSPDKYHLTDDEKSEVEEIIRSICADKHVTHVGCDYPVTAGCYHSAEEYPITLLIEQAIHLIETAAGAPGCEAREGEEPRAVLASELTGLLRKCDCAKDIAPFIDKLIEIWWSLRKRRVSLFGHAAHAYFQYLSHSSAELQPSYHHDALKGKTRSYTMRAMLYLLHIMLNYGVELKETLESGVSAVPLLPWQEIIPQLFARLSSHPEKIVRELLESILLKLGKLSPCSIVYPTLVDINACEGEPSEELQHISDFLVKLFPNLIKDVKLAIEELGMITVLWEEQWLSTLQDLHSDVLRRINILKEEAARVAANSTLSSAEKNKINAAKYSAVMTPIIVALERRLASTSREPKTSHEMWFHKEYNAKLKSAITTLKTPPGSPAALGEIWQPFDSIAASLATHQRKSCILLSEIAPQLAVLSTSDIPMPGFEKQIVDSSESFAGNHGTVTVSSFCKEVTILSTKTRPKKLVLQGSDGQRYTYLLKGREDLRLDSRIMQLLEAINSLLYSSSDTRSRNITLRFYSVTPVSGRAGLIQWVENVSSIYNVYKSWQKRSQLAQAEAQISSVNTGNIRNPIPPVPRPSDMFYGKIIPALKEKGIKRVVSRRDWPLDVKRKVLLELMNETPKQILWQEMWCASEGFRNFNSKVKRFSSSVAAMSMVGHMLGLGDRHLDNILMDFSNGDVVHIDYNICFDKGKRLKIPEIVPFRLTQTIESALGLTGVEGVFRVTCEEVMDVLLKNKDIILMLLEVFVWDPLMEWTRGNIQDEAGIAGEEKKGMELAVSLSLFSSRIQEIRVPLQEHKDLFLTNLPATVSALKKFLDTLDHYEIASAMFYHVEKERSSVLQNEMSAKSVLADATSVAEKSRTSFEIHAHELAEAKAAAVDEANKLQIWVEKHARVLEAIRDNSIACVESCMQLNCKDEALSLISAVPESGVPLTVVPEPTRAQCSELDREVSQLISELQGGLSSALDSLGEYSLMLQQVLPVNYIRTSPISSWAQVLELSVRNTSQDMLSVAKRQAAEFITKVQGEGIHIAQQRYRDLLNQMESYVACVERLVRECSELMNSIGLDNEMQSKERILSVFMNSVQLPSQKDSDNTHLSHSESLRQGEIKTPASGDMQETTCKVLSILGIAVGQLYSDIRAKVSDISTKAIGKAKIRADDSGLPADVGMGLQFFEQHIEKCSLISGVVDEVHEVIGKTLAETSAAYIEPRPRHWASTFQVTLHSSINIIEQMTEVFLPEFIRLFVSNISEVREAIGSISKIRGSVDKALERLVEVELERTSLTELEQSYSVKVGRITQQQIALEEAAARGREHLSWEEAEELASQEEICRAQLEQLHETWSQKDMRISSLMKVEDSIINSLLSSKQDFSSLVDRDHESDFHFIPSKALLSILTKPFADLESLDRMLSPCGVFPSDIDRSISNMKDALPLGSSLSDAVWPLAGILKDHAFFVWELGLLDLILDLCMHEISSSVEQSINANQLYMTLKNKLAIHVEKQVFWYITARIAPSLILSLDEEISALLQPNQERGKLDQPKRDSAAVGKVTLMLEEYCNAHETARASRAAVSLMKKQLNELTEALRKIILEVVQVEWLHDLSSPHAQKAKVLSQNILRDDKFSSLILNLSRSNLLDKIQSSVSLITRSIEFLQACESISVSAEGQLERAMGWACAGPSTSGAGSSTAKGSGIPPEFHGHILKRRKLLQVVQEEASDLVKLCTSVLEFEASRDGLYFIPEGRASEQSMDKGRAWQQFFLNLLTRLDAAYHSFTCAEQEWKLGQLNLETAGKGLFSVNNQVSVVSVKAKSALVNLQDALVAMYDHACEVSVLLSGFKHVSQDRTALTSECGSLLEEVLAIADGLHDVYSLGKEAAAVHNSLMANLSKANAILFPLEACLSADVTVMSEAISKERENNSASMPLIHGKALYQSYNIKIREACKNIEPLVGPLTENVEGLHSIVMKLGHLSSLHAGNLHKALEVPGEDIPSTHPDLLQSDSSTEKDRGSSESLECGSPDLEMNTDISLQDGCWISPPEHSYTSSSGCTTGLTQIGTSDNLGKIDALMDDKAKGEGPGDNDQETRDGNDNQSVSNNIALTHDSNIHEIETHLMEGRIESENSSSAFKQVRGQEFDSSDPKSNADSSFRVTRGKNPFALSILKQVEHKLHGRDIDGTRSLNISEQVDYLLKQATSIDNLCNMYEGWTPWI